MTFILSVFLLGTLVCEILVVIWLYKHDISANERISHPKEWSRSEQIKNKIYKEESIPPLDPETFTNIKNPPKPSGGFGSVVGKNDGSS